jgi:hypothetical protein
MSFDVAIRSSPARVRTASVLRDVGRKGRGGGVWFVVAPIAPPRLWQMVNDAVAAAFDASIGDARGGEPALHRALGATAQAIARVQSALVEPNLAIDAQFAALVALDNVVLLTVSSGMRVYRARSGEPQRLLDTPQRSPGLSRGGMVVATERLVRGDLFVLGSRNGFGTRSVGAIAALLARRSDAASREVCDAALDPCAAAGIGASLVTLRVR